MSKEEIRIVTLNPLTVASYQSIGAEPEETALNFLTEWFKKRSLALPTARKFGFDVPVSEEQQSLGQRGYEVWFSTAPGTKGDTDVQVKEFKGGKFASLRLVDPFSDPWKNIPGGWERLHQWVVENEDVEFRHEPCLEEHIETGSGLDLVLYMGVK